MNKIIIISLLALSIFSCKSKDKKAAEKDCCKKEMPVAKTTLPEQSLFQIENTFTNQDNKAEKLADFKGKPTVIGMIFTHCQYACPRLTSDMVNIETSLKENADKVNFLLISFDTERDIPSQLKKYAKDHKLDKNWTLLHTDDETVRTLAVLLNVQFEKDSDGNFSHSNLVSVLDKDGVLQYQKEGLEADHKTTIEKINQLLK